MIALGLLLIAPLAPAAVDLQADPASAPRTGDPRNGELPAGERPASQLPTGERPPIERSPIERPPIEPTDEPPLSGTYPGCPSCPVPVATARTAGACADWRWIGVLADPSAHCPLPPHPWTARRLFDDPGGTPPAGPAPFCLFEHPDRGGDLTTAGLPGLTALSRDCMVVVPQQARAPARAPALARPLLPLLEARLLSAAGAVRLTPRGAANRGGDRPRLAIVDTHPTSERPLTLPFNSPHGYALAGIARRQLCDGGSCPVTIATRLALAYVTFNPRSRRLSLRDEVRGGFVGSQGELAEAIWDEVRGGDRPVLNLSVGWDGDRFGGLEAAPDDMPPPARAVYRALQDAVCQGTLTLAAAGNQGWGAAPGTGPLLPAGWERRTAPTPSECAAALAPGPAPTLPDAAYRPLLAAVGGVDGGDRPLANARFGSEPSLAGYADHALVPTPIGVPPLTGSSVAALGASVAATAALAQLEQPPGPFRLLALLYDNGDDLGRRAAFQLGVQPRAVRRIDLCATARAACKQRPCVAACLNERPGGGPQPQEPAVELAPLFDQAPRLDLAQFAPREIAAAAPTCPPPAVAAALVRAGRASAERYRGSDPLYRCPYWQLPGVASEAWVGPQPGSDPCSACDFDRDDGVLSIEIDPDFWGDLSSPTLKIGEQVFGLDLKLSAGGRAQVTGLPAPAEGEEVLLSFVVDRSRSATSVVLVRD